MRTFFKRKSPDLQVFETDQKKELPGHFRS